MNVTQNLNFSSKLGVSAHYIPHMILAQRNWDYNKNFRVEFCFYVQASQANDTKNKNRPRTLDRIHLCPAPNFQGGHHIMDLRTVQFIKRPKLVYIPIIDVVINTVEKMSEEQVFKSLNFYDKIKEINYFPWCRFGRSGPLTTNITN